MNKLLKRLLDLFFGLMIIFFITPVIIIISLVSIIAHGFPIFFIHKRLGLNGKPFNMIKFRSMLVGPSFSAEDDVKRITSLGRLLRKTSLDELPQFINVLRNEMSIVGPRPIVKAEKKKYGKNFKKLLSIKPGITGLWQVSGRNNLTYKKRVSLDLNYVKNYNLLMDIRILIRTFGVILFPLDKGAY